MPHNSSGTLWFQRSWQNSDGITPNSSDRCRLGRLKLATFNKELAITRKQYAQFLLNSTRKLYALYRMFMLTNNLDGPLTLSHTNFSILEVDFKYPNELHDLRNGYPLAPENVKVNEVYKLIPNLNNKTN